MNAVTQVFNHPDIIGGVEIDCSPITGSSDDIIRNHHHTVLGRDTVQLSKDKWTVVAHSYRPCEWVYYAPFGHAAVMDAMYKREAVFMQRRAGSWGDQYVFELLGRLLSAKMRNDRTHL